MLYRVKGVGGRLSFVIPAKAGIHVIDLRVR
jgi:hypothetical protein